MRSEPRQTIVLSRPAAIRGTAYTLGGDPAPPGSLALAWPQEMGKTPDVEPFVSIIRDDDVPGPSSSIRVAEVQADGSFEIANVDPSVPYFCLAGGRGFLSSVTPLRKGAGEVHLDLAYAYGAVMQYCDPYGAEIELSATLVRSRHLRFWSDEASVQSAPLSGVGALLAGVPLELLRESTRGEVTLFLSESDLDRVGPCHFYLDVPGFEPVDVSYAPTALDVAILEVPIVMERWACETGAVVLHFADAGERVARSFRRSTLENPSSKIMVLHLTDRRTGRRLEFGLDADLDHPVELGDVPVGSYDWKLVSWDQLVHLPATPRRDELTVTSGTVADLVLDMSRYGTLVIDLFLEDGRRFDGISRLSLTLGEPHWKEDGEYTLKGAAVRTFDRAPYAFGLVEAGDYTIRLSHPESSARREFPELVFCRVESGAVTVSRFDVVSAE